MKNNFINSPELTIDTAQLTNYLKTRVLPILQPLQMQILQNRPMDIRHFSYNWLQSSKDGFLNNNGNRRNSDIKGNFIQQSQDEQPEEIFKEKLKRRKQKQKEGRKGFRLGVCGQPSALMNLHQKRPQRQETMSFVRSQQTKIKILVELRNSILFKNMNHSSLLKIIQRMKPHEFRQGDIVIAEGDDGNELFIVDEGQFKCQVKGKKTHEKIYGPGEAFGELALLYNTKRASTIIAQTPGRLYSLGRLQFNTILRQTVLRKTEMCQRILSNIQIFQTLDRYEKSKVYESMQQIEITAGKYVICEGQVGDCFYIVAQGKLVAQKKQDGEIKPVYYYKQGDYFGELAIIKNIVRQASVKALTKVRLLFIERSSFKRSLGSIETILRRNESRYKNATKLKKGKPSFERDNCFV